MACRETGARFLHARLLLVVGAAWVGCSSNPKSSATGLAAPTVEVRDEPAGSNCASGGVEIVEGTDKNHDGKLSADEVTSSHYVCGAASPVGQLVATHPIEPGTACASGGVEIVTGKDENGDGMLSASEVTGTTMLCTSAMAGTVSTETLASGDKHCPSGGIAIHHGTDANGNGTLEPSEVASTDYLCNGASFDGSSLCFTPTRWDAKAARCTVQSDWSGSELTGAELGNLYLAGIDFANAHLGKANLSWSDLRGAIFMGADLSGANLGHALVTGADFTDATLTGADLTGVDMRNATLERTQGAMLAACPDRLPSQWNCIDLGASGKTLVGPGSSLSGLDLTGANLSQADLGGAQAVNLAGCPAMLPQDWKCLDFPHTGRTLVGPGADLSMLNLGNADFTPATNLRGVSFDGSMLSGATFANGTNLRDTTWTSADMTGLDLSNANLEGAAGRKLVNCPASLPGSWSCLDLGSTAGKTLVGPGTSLRGLDLTGANFSGKDLSGVDLSNANLTNAVLNGADLQNATLAGATLSGVQAAHLQNCPDMLPGQWTCKGRTLLGPGANLSNQTLTNLDFSGANTRLNGADLSGANLSNTDLSNANLTDANLSGANLTNTTFADANLTNANLTNANLTGADLTNAMVNNAVTTGATWQNTTCPNGSTKSTACF